MVHTYEALCIICLFKSFILPSNHPKKMSGLRLTYPSPCFEQTPWQPARSSTRPPQTAEALQCLCQQWPSHPTPRRGTGSSVAPSSGRQTAWDCPRCSGTAWRCRCLRRILECCLVGWTIPVYDWSINEMFGLGFMLKFDKIWTENILKFPEWQSVSYAI